MKYETGMKRRRVRKKMLRGGRIIFNRGFSTMPCTILEFTEDGAAVKPIAGEILPRYFILGLPDGRRFNCEYIHRTNDVVGVRFEKS
jgi:hypothetical protein